LVHIESPGWHRICRPGRASGRRVPRHLLPASPVSRGRAVQL